MFAEVSKGVVPESRCSIASVDGYCAHSWICLASTFQVFRSNVQVLFLNYKCEYKYFGLKYKYLGLRYKYFSLKYRCKYKSLREVIIQVFHMATERTIRYLFL